MPIVLGNVPEAAVVAVHDAIRQRAVKSAFATPNLRSIDIKTLERSTPHRVAHLTLDQIRRGGDLRQIMQPDGWRFLIHAEGRVVAAAKVINRDADNYHLSELSEGPFVGGTEAAIRFAEDHMQSGDFEPVFLMAPEVHIVALLFLNLNADQDKVIVIPASHHPKPPFLREMTPAAFLEKLQCLAATIRSYRSTARP